MIITAIGVYSINTKDKHAVAIREDIRSIVFSHAHVLQMHGFYVNEEKKSIRFDVIVSFDAKNRKEVYKEIVADVQKKYPGYTLNVALDTDFLVS